MWDTKQRRWKDRQRGIAIGHLVYGTPAEGERYYLRLSLTSVRGPKSFEDLLTVDDHRCATFKESALRRGLLEHDNSIELCMDEGIRVHMPCALHRLFATLLIFCQPSDPRSLWDKYYAFISEDNRHAYPNDEAKVSTNDCQTG